MPNKEDYYFTDQDGHKLKPKGMSLICHYYRNKHNLSNMFSAANYDETANLIGQLKRDDNRFGIVYINTSRQSGGTSHKGAIVVDGQTAFILDSLGTGVGSGAMALKEYLIEQGLFEKNNIYISNVRIQWDYTSCGTLSFLFLKEALRMGSTFRDFMFANKDAKQEISTLPPNLLKYMQSISRIQELDQDNQKDYGFYPQMPVRSSKYPQKTESLMEFVIRHTEQRYSPKKQAKVDQSVVTSKRADKHIAKINNLLSDYEELDRIEEEMAIVTGKDYSKEILVKDIPDPFLFTPIRQEKVRTAVVEQSSDYMDEFNAFAFMPTPPVTPPRQGNSRANSNQSTPTRSPLRDITSTTNLHTRRVLVMSSAS